MYQSPLCPPDRHTASNKCGSPHATVVTPLPADALPRFFRKQAAAAAAAQQQTPEERAAAEAKAAAAAAERKAPVPWGKFLARCELVS